LLTHPPGLEVTHLLGLVYADVHSLVVTLGRARHVVAVVRCAGLEWESLAGGVRQLPVDGLGHCPAVINRLLPTNLTRLRAIAVGGNVLADFFIDFDTLLDILNHRSVLVSRDTRGLVLSLTHFIRNLAVLRRRTNSLHGVVALLQSLGHAGLDVLNVTFLLEVLAALVLRGGRVLGDVGEVALLVHLVNTLLHWDLL